MRPDTMEAMHGAHEESGESADEVQRFWVYKRGQLVLVLTSSVGSFVPTLGIPNDGDPTGLMTPFDFASGQFMSLEWEPRIRMILRRAEDLVDLIERLEDRKYEVDLEPPSQRSRPFRWL
jgi:hypothetical protein